MTYFKTEHRRALSMLMAVLMVLTMMAASLAAPVRTFADYTAGKPVSADDATFEVTADQTRDEVNVFVAELGEKVTVPLTEPYNVAAIEISGEEIWDITEYVTVTVTGDDLTLDNETGFNLEWEPETTADLAIGTNNKISYTVEATWCDELSDEYSYDELSAEEIESLDFELTVNTYYIKAAEGKTLTGDELTEEMTLGLATLYKNGAEDENGLVYGLFKDAAGSQKYTGNSELTVGDGQLELTLDLSADGTFADTGSVYVLAMVNELSKDGPDYGGPALVCLAELKFSEPETPEQPPQGEGEISCDCDASCDECSQDCTDCNCSPDNDNSKDDENENKVEIEIEMEPGVLVFDFSGADAPITQNVTISATVTGGEASADVIFTIDDFTIDGVAVNKNADGFAVTVSPDDAKLGDYDIGVKIHASVEISEDGLSVDEVSVDVNSKVTLQIRDSGKYSIVLNEGKPYEATVDAVGDVIGELKYTVSANDLSPEDYSVTYAFAGVESYVEESGDYLVAKAVPSASVEGTVTAQLVVNDSVYADSTVGVKLNVVSADVEEPGCDCEESCDECSQDCTDCDCSTDDDNKGGGGTGGGDDGPGGGPSGDTTTPTTPTDPDTTEPEVEEVVQEMAPVASTTENGKASAEVDSKAMDETIAKAVEEAGKKANGAPVVVVPVVVPEGAEALEVKLPAASIKKLAEAKNAALDIKSNVGEVKLDSAALKALAEDADENDVITLEIEGGADALAEMLNEAQLEEIGKIVEILGEEAYAEIFDVTLYINDEPKGDFGGGKIQITVPAPEKVNASNVHVYYLRDNGTLERMRDVKFADGKVSFSTTHLSMYIISSKALEAEFDDVAESDWFYDAVMWAFANGITKGVDDTHFAPADNCTRAQFVTFLWRAAGSPEPAGSANPFTDVSEALGDYYKPILWAYEQGVTNGATETTFEPSANVLRGQAVTFMCRYAAKAGIATKTGAPNFTDVVNEGVLVDYYEAIGWAVANGITNGIGGGLFGPMDNCERGQMITFLHRLFTDAAV